MIVVAVNKGSSPPRVKQWGDALVGGLVALANSWLFSGCKIVEKRYYLPLIESQELTKDEPETDIARTL